MSLGVCVRVRVRTCVHLSVHACGLGMTAYIFKFPFPTLSWIVWWVYTHHTTAGHSYL